MRYGIAIWNFVEPGQPLPDLIAEFAGFGFDTISFLPGQLLNVPQEEARAAARALRELGLQATVHGNFVVTGDDVRRLADLLGPDYVCQTFDAALMETSWGRVYDASHMAALLVQVNEALGPWGGRCGVEDFPLDAAARDYYAPALAPLLALPRYGMLVDLGHLNMRLTQHDYYRDLTPAEYLGRTPLPIVEVHVHDNCGDRDDHAPLGDGTGDFASMAAGLRNKGFEGISTIEIAPTFHGSTPAIDKPYARESLERWRSLLEG